MVLNLENFGKKTYNLALIREHFHKYFEMRFHAKFLNLKTFKDFSFMQNQRLLKTFGRHQFFLKTSIKIVTLCPYF